jgi:hypothetical protein
MAEVIEDSALAATLAKRSAARVERFDGEVARQTFLEHLVTVI